IITPAPSSSPTSTTRRGTTSCTATPSACWDITCRNDEGGGMAEVRDRLKVALVDLDGQPVPDWVRQILAQEGIELIVRGCTTRGERAEPAGDAEVVWLFGGSRVLQGGNLAALPRCRAIVRTGSGTDNVPVDEATRRQIVVANTPAAVSDGVSDHLIALLFAVTRRVAELDRAVRLGRWGQVPTRPLNGVQGRTLGVIGFGRAARGGGLTLS